MTERKDAHGRPVTYPKVEKPIPHVAIDPSAPDMVKKDHCSEDPMHPILVRGLPSGFVMVDPSASAEARKAIESSVTDPVRSRYVWKPKESFVMGGALFFLLEFTSGHVGPLPEGGAGLIVLCAGFVGMDGILAGVSSLRAAKRKREASRKYEGILARFEHVKEEDLNKDARELLARTIAACEAVLLSRVHREGILGRQHDEIALPEQKWAIAKALLSYSRAEKKIPVLPDGSGPELAQVVSARQKALKAGLDSVVAKVAALEEYAAKVRLLDRQHAENERRRAEIERARALTQDDSDLIDLLAQTASDGMYLDEIKQMNNEAKSLSEIFEKTLSEAHSAALIALPETS